MLSICPKNRGKYFLKKGKAKNETIASKCHKIASFWVVNFKNPPLQPHLCTQTEAGTSRLKMDNSPISLVPIFLNAL